MKLQCKLCSTVVEVTEPIQGGITMVKHVQTKHAVKAFEIINAIAPYAATFCYTVPDAEVNAYNDTRKALLQGFKEYAEVIGVKK